MQGPKQMEKRKNSSHTLIKKYRMSVESKAEENDISNYEILSQTVIPNHKP